MIVFAVDAHLLWQVMYVSLLAGVAISALFSLVILGSVRASEARRARQGAAVLLYGAVAVVSFGLFALGVVLGVEAMITK
jgi:hypothetical protein